MTGANFTNALVTVSISGSKTWADDSDHYGMRPDGITLTVLKDGVAIVAATHPELERRPETCGRMALPGFPGTRRTHT